MRKVLMAVLLLAGMPAFGQAGLLFTWTAESIPACSTTVTTSCIVAQTITDVTNAATPVVISSSIAPTAASYLYTIPVLTAAAQRTFSLVVNAKDSSGSAVNSAAATAPVAVPAIPPPAPAGFGAAVQTASAAPAQDQNGNAILSTPAGVWYDGADRGVVIFTAKLVHGQ